MQFTALLRRMFADRAYHLVILEFTIAPLILFVLINDAAAQTLSPLWSVAPGTSGYDLVITNDQIRGVAYNAVTDHFLYVRRTGATTGIRVKRLNAQTGALLSDMNADSAVITGGSVSLSALAATEDGVIYGCNISGSSTVTPAFRLYRWADEAASPVLVYSGSLDSSLARVGDAMAVRGTGTNTLLLIGSDQLTVAFLTTTNPASVLGSWTGKKVTVTGGMGNFYRAALAFGAGNSFYGKTSGNNLHRVNFDLTAGTASFAFSYTTAVIPATVGGIAFDPVRNLMLGNTRSSSSGVNHTNFLWNFANPDSPQQLDAKAFPTANSDGAAGVNGAALGGNKAFGSVQNNGLVAYQLNFTLDISDQPQSQVVVEGGYATLSVAVTGLPPLSYQWFHDGNEIPGATTNSLLVTNFAASDAGTYWVRVTNSAATTQSSNAVLTLEPTVLSHVMTPLWQIAPGSVSYLANDNNTRGIAYNPISGHLVMVSRTGSNAVHVLDADTGAHIRALTWDPGVITGGTIVVNMVGVNEDGVIFVGNLTQNGVTSAFRLYGWADESPEASPYLAWQGDPGAGTVNRWGDTLSVRGSGDSTQILLGSRTGTVASVISPALGPNSAPLVIQTDAAAGNLGLGISFGLGNSFWAKAFGPNLPFRLIQFDAGTGMGQTIISCADYHNIGPIGADGARALLAGISIETPDNLRLFDVSGGVIPVDTEFFPTDNANNNGTGSIAFAPDRIFALDSNNGLIAMTLQTTCLPDTLQIQTSGTNVILSWNRSSYRLQAATELLHPPANTIWNDVSPTSPATVPAKSGNRFFRLICP